MSRVRRGQEVKEVQKRMSQAEECVCEKTRALFSFYSF